MDTSFTQSPTTSVAGAEE